MEEESTITVQDGRSEEEEFFNEEGDKAANEDKPQFFIEQCQLVLSASNISLNNRFTTPFS